MDDLFSGLTVLITSMLILVGLRTRTTPSLRSKEEGVVKIQIIILLNRSGGGNQNGHFSYYRDNGLYADQRGIVLNTVFRIFIPSFQSLDSLVRQ